jgi:hypothetical protein
MKNNYAEKSLYPCWKSVVYIVADELGGRNPQAARAIARDWESELSLSVMGLATPLRGLVTPLKLLGQLHETGKVSYE